MCAGVLAKARRNVKPLTPEEFAILISPAADPFLEEMAQLSRHFTLERFGKTISMYIDVCIQCLHKQMRILRF